MTTPWAPLMLLVSFMMAGCAAGNGMARPPISGFGKADCQPELGSLTIAVDGVVVQDGVHEGDVAVTARPGESLSVDVGMTGPAAGALSQVEAIVLTRAAAAKSSPQPSDVRGQGDLRSKDSRGHVVGAVSWHSEPSDDHAYELRLVSHVQPPRDSAPACAGDTLLIAHVSVND